MNSSVSGGLASVPSAKDSSSTTCCGSCRSNRSTLAVQSFRILVLLCFLCFLNPIAVACCRGCKQSKKSFGRVSRSNLTATCLGGWKRCTRDASEEFHRDGKANGTLVEKGQREGKSWVDSTFLLFHWHTCLQVSTVFACKHTCTTVIAAWAFYRWNMLISRGKKIQRIQFFHFWEASCAWGYERCLFSLQYCSQGNAPLYCWNRELTGSMYIFDELFSDLWSTYYVADKVIK